MRAVPGCPRAPRLPIVVSYGWDDPDAAVAAAVARVPDIRDDAAWGSDSWVGSPAPVDEPLLVGLPDVVEEPVEWLWEERIPLGALTILDGHPGTGKSTITMDLAARVSLGRRMPDGSKGIQGATILLSAEDMLARPIKSRLEAAEADLSRIFGLEGVVDQLNPLGRLLSLPRDTRIIHRAILNVNARLVIIDPFFSYLDGEINTGIDAEVRKAMMPLTRVAAETGCAMVLVRHLRKPDKKGDGKPNLFEGGGSLGGLIGAARSGLGVMRDPENEFLCTLHQTKSNWGAWRRPIDYSIEGLARGDVGRIVWHPR